MNIQSGLAATTVAIKSKVCSCQMLPCTLIKDETSKSLSFFHEQKEGITFGLELTKAIKTIAFESKSNVRINLHSSAECTYHDMIIFQWKGTYVRPHKHLKKVETCHMIEGTQEYILQNETGEIISNEKLSANGNVIYRINNGVYHTSFILSDFVIFHESKIGPFVQKGDSVYLESSPVGESITESDEYMMRLYGNLRIS